MRQIKYIAQHCSATREGQDVSLQDVSLQDIGRRHRQRGFRKNGCQFVILLDSSFCKGRDIAGIGVHAAGSNVNSIGIRYVGGVAADAKPKETRTDKLKALLFFVPQQLGEQFPDAMICGHRDFSPDLNGDGSMGQWKWIKACPSFDTINEYQNL